MELIHPWGSVTYCQENTATDGKVWRDRWLVLNIEVYLDALNKPLSKLFEF